MTTTPTAKASDYAVAYAKGRHAGQENVPAKENPHRAGTLASRGWIDGYYDARSARCLAIARHSAQLWSDAGSREYAHGT